HTDPAGTERQVGKDDRQVLAHLAVRDVLAALRPGLRPLLRATLRLERNVVGRTLRERGVEEGDGLGGSCHERPDAGAGWRGFVAATARPTYRGQRCGQTARERDEREGSSALHVYFSFRRRGRRRTATHVPMPAGAPDARVL